MEWLYQAADTAAADGAWITYTYSCGADLTRKWDENYPRTGRSFSHATHSAESATPCGRLARPTRARSRRTRRRQRRGRSARGGAVDGCGESTTAEGWIDG